MAVAQLHLDRFVALGLVDVAIVQANRSWSWPFIYRERDFERLSRVGFWLRGVPARKRHAAWTAQRFLDRCLDALVWRSRPGLLQLFRDGGDIGVDGRQAVQP